MVTSSVTSKIVRHSGSSKRIRGLSSFEAAREDGRSDPALPHTLRVFGIHRRTSRKLYRSSVGPAWEAAQHGDRIGRRRKKSTRSPTSASLRLSGRGRGRTLGPRRVPRLLCLDETNHRARSGGQTRFFISKPLSTDRDHRSTIQLRRVERFRDAGNESRISFLDRPRRRAPIPPPHR